MPTHPTDDTTYDPNIRKSYIPKYSNASTPMYP